MACSECMNHHHPGLKKVYSCCNPNCHFKGHRDEASVTTFKKVLARILICLKEYRNRQVVEIIEVDVIEVEGVEQEEEEEGDENPKSRKNRKSKSIFKISS